MVSVRCASCRASANPGQGGGDRGAARRSWSSCCPGRPTVPDVVEDADTLEGNAWSRRRRICAATGVPAVADDTGLEVAALGGRPGRVHRPLRRRARDLRRQPGQAAAPSSTGVERPAGPGSARSRCCSGPTAPRSPSRGLRGRDPDRRRGAAASATTRCSSRVDGDGRTFAEMTEDEKHAVSHRGRAFRALAAALPGS